MKRTMAVMLSGLWALPVMVQATPLPQLHSPAPGVVCDASVCATAGGVSQTLTEQYLGKKQGARLRMQGDAGNSAFTFASGVHCDVKKKVCWLSRYFGPDGRPSGTVDGITTEELFGG